MTSRIAMQGIQKGREEGGRVEISKNKACAGAARLFRGALIPGKTPAEIGITPLGSAIHGDVVLNECSCSALVYI